MPTFEHAISPLDCRWQVRHPSDHPWQVALGAASGLVAAGLAGAVDRAGGAGLSGRSAAPAAPDSASSTAMPIHKGFRIDIGLPHNGGKPNASAGLSTKISMRVFSSGTQSSIMSSSATSFGIGLKYC